MAKELLRGKTALITGSAKRLGEATALALADRGINVIIHYRNSESEACKLREELINLGVKAWIIQADFEKTKDYPGLIKQATEKSGQVDILINNASIFSKSNMANITLEDFNLNVKVNAWSPFALSRAFAKKVKKGKIINFLDAKIKGYMWEHFPYYISKQMLCALTKMCALEFAPYITVNAVAPGRILPPEGKDESYLERNINQVPLKTYGSPEDVTEAILYLLKSTFITGQIIYVDGGWHLNRTKDG